MSARETGMQFHSSSLGREQHNETSKDRMVICETHTVVMPVGQLVGQVDGVAVVFVEQTLVDVVPVSFRNLL